MIEPPKSAHHDSYLKYWRYTHLYSLSYPDAAEAARVALDMVEDGEGTPESLTVDGDLVWTRGGWNPCYAYLESIAAPAD